MGSTIEGKGDVLVVAGRCSSCGAQVAKETVGAKTDCCASGRVMAWRVQRQPAPRLTDPIATRPRPSSTSG